MARKSKQAGSGHLPLTHYERTKKFKKEGGGTDYGTTTTRLLGDTISIPFGYCNLSLTPIIQNESTSNSNDDGGNYDSNTTTTATTTTAVITPSGYMYNKEAIYEYLVTKKSEIATRKMKRQQQRQEQQQQRQEQQQQQQQSSSYNEEATNDDKKAANVLKRTSYWLPDMQPSLNTNDEDDIDDDTMIERPMSPNSGNPLRRKDLKEVQLLYEDVSSDNSKKRPATTTTPPNPICALSGKIIRNQIPMAYWTKSKSSSSSLTSSSSSLGTVVLKDVFEMTTKQDNKDKDKKKKSSKEICPLTGEKIRKIIILQRGASGTSYCANHQSQGGDDDHNKIQVKKYKPTIT